MGTPASSGESIMHYALRRSHTRRAAARSARANPADLKRVICPGSVRPGWRPATRSARSARISLSSITPDASGAGKVAGAQCSGPGIHEDGGPPDRLVIGLAHVRAEAADEIHVRPGPQQASGDQRFRGAGHAGDQVGACHGAVEVARHRRGETRAGQILDDGPGAAGIAAPHLHRREDPAVGVSPRHRRRELTRADHEQAAGVRGGRGDGRPEPTSRPCAAPSARPRRAPRPAGPSARRTTGSRR